MMDPISLNKTYSKGARKDFALSYSRHKVSTKELSSPSDQIDVEMLSTQKKYEEPISLYLIQ